eukprot:scaffold7063_cov351-Pinguiococcus_pyrenoidosus.AAC.4
MGDPNVHIHLCQASFTPGERLVGAVTLDLPSAAEIPEVEAIGLRLHGHARLDPRWIQLPQSLRKLYSQGVGETLEAAAESALRRRNSAEIPPFEELLPQFPELQSENTACIFTTPAVVLLRGPLCPGEPRQWLFSCRLPDAMVPSFRGWGCRYFYHVTVSLCGRGGALRHLHFPFQILCAGLPSSSSIKYVTTSTIAVQEVAFDPHPNLDSDSGPNATADPFINPSPALARPSVQFQGYNLDGAFVEAHPTAGLAGLLGESSPEELVGKRVRDVTSFRIRHENDHVCTVTLSRTKWYPGDAVAIGLDFR